jgi:cytochrome c556
MNRKWVALTVTLVSAALFVTGISIAADDEDSPLHKIMEKVQAKNTAITKGVRNPSFYAKSQKAVSSAAEDLVKLGKEAKPYNEVAKKKKEVADPVAKWEGFMDDFVKEADTFAKLVAKPGTKQPEAKEGYKAVSKSCNACHEVFRPEE